MNKTFKLISLGLLTTVALSSTSVNADCIGSGFGVGVTLSARQQKITFNDKNIKKAHENARNGLKDKLKEAIAATQSKFSKPNDASNLKKDGGLYDTIVYSAGNAGNSIAGKNGDWANQNQLSDNETILKLKGPKFEGNNPTKYRILTPDTNNKYNANGMIDANNGSSLPKQAILVLPGFLADNNVTINNPQAQPILTNTADNRNYSSLVTNINNVQTTYYITPKNQYLLTEMDANNLPTHAELSDIFTTKSDQVCFAFLNDIVGGNNEAIRNKYGRQFENDEYFRYGDKLYINTVKHPDLGITDEIIENAISALAPDPSTSKALSNTFKDVSKWSFDLGFNIFYQHRIFDWFIRAGLFGNFPIANRTISLVSNNTNNNNNNNTDSKDKKSSKDDVSLTHSFDIGAQLLFGYNVTQSFALVFGGELGYSRYKLNNVNKLLSGYNMNSDNDNLVNWVAAGSTKEEVLKEYNNKLKEYGLSDKDKEKSFNKFFWRLIAGVEFNVGKCIVGLHGFFGPNTSLMDSKNKKDFGDLKVVNGGVRASIAFKF